MRASEASTEANVMGADIAGISSGLRPDKTLHFRYTSGPQSVTKVA